MSRAVLHRIGAVLIGYALAAIAAASAASAALILAMAVSQTLMPNVGLAETIGTFLFMTLFASIVTFFTALPVWAPFAALAEWRAIRSRAACLAAGAAASVPFLLAKWTDEPDRLALASACLFAGLSGGWAYWAIAGRNAGKWREAIL